MLDSLSEKVYAGRTEKFTEQESKDNIQEKSWIEISPAEIRKSTGAWKKTTTCVWAGWWPY
jgi:hypothetical protein